MEILQVCAYGAEHPGNFMASLLALEARMAQCGYRTIYAFPEKARNRRWCRELQQRTAVYFLPEAKARILPKTYAILGRIYRSHDVRLVHSHFELYDIPATVMAPRGTGIFWHLHDPIQPRGNRALLCRIQYGLVGRRAQLLSVAEYYRDVVVGLGFPGSRSRILLNSIALDRIQDCRGGSCSYEFLTFGWDFHRKGDDLILEACDRLWREGHRFRLLLNGNEKTWAALDAHLAGRPEPEYLVRGNPVEDVNELFRASRVFVQASRKETFSYAVCEAAYAGLPVISSDIPGLEWARELPTVSFFPSEQAQELYAQMKWRLSHPVSDGDVAETRRRIGQTYSLSSWTDRVMAAYGVKGE